MDETQIVHVLDEAYPASGLVFQVLQEGDTLYVYINRPSAAPLDYEPLAHQIRQAIAALSLPSIQQLGLYSRPLGSVEPDWDTHLTLAPADGLVPTSTESIPAESIHTAPIQPDPVAQQEEAKPAVVESSSVPANAEAEMGETPADHDLGQYCFIRNRALLTSEILPPPEPIARLIRYFDTLSPLDQQQALPYLEQFFKNSQIPAAEGLSVEVQTWFQDLGQIKPTDLRKVAIWMSRYCLDAIAAMKQVQAVLGDPPSLESSNLPTRSVTPVASSPVNAPDPSFQIYTAALASPPQKGTASSEQPPAPTEAERQTALSTPSKPSGVAWQILLVPLVWLLFTIIAVGYNVHIQNNSPLLAELCKGAKENQPYCRLAGQMIGAERMAQLAKKTLPINDYSVGQSIVDCKQISQRNAGLDPKTKTPPGSQTTAPTIQKAEVLPGLLLVDIQQPSVKDGSVVRTACAFHQGTFSEDLEGVSDLVADDIIPAQWPTQAYKNKSFAATLQTSLTVHSTLGMLGSNILFTAAGIFVAAYFGLAVSVDSMTTLYKSAFVFGVIETVTSFIPFGGLFRTAAMGVLALLITSAVVKEFDVDWTSGYWPLACGALAIIATRSILNWILLLSILWVMGA